MRSYSAEMQEFSFQEVHRRLEAGGRRVPLPGGRRGGVAPSGAARSAGGERSRRSVRAEREQKKSPTVVRQSGTRRTAATYSPNWWVSTIGDGELNFSVRNGKRWILTAITAFHISLGERKLDTYSLLANYASSLKRSIRDISTDRL